MHRLEVGSQEENDVDIGDENQLEIGSYVHEPSQESQQLDSERKLSSSKSKEQANDSVVKGRPKKHQRQDEAKSQKEQEQEFKYDDIVLEQEMANEFRKILIIFEYQVGLPKGFVFSKLERKKLMKEESKRSRPAFKWRGESQWSETQELSKIKAYKDDTEAFSDLQEFSLFKEICLKSSYIFADEITPQLYLILYNTWKICKTAHPGQRSTQLQQYGERIYLNHGECYNFFSLSFCKFIKCNSKKISTHQKLVQELGQQIIKAMNKQTLKNSNTL